MGDLQKLAKQRFGAMRKRNDISSLFQGIHGIASMILQQKMAKEKEEKDLRRQKELIGIEKQNRMDVAGFTADLETRSRKDVAQFEVDLGEKTEDKRRTAAQEKWGKQAEHINNMIVAAYSDDSFGNPKSQIATLMKAQAALGTIPESDRKYVTSFDTKQIQNQIEEIMQSMRDTEKNDLRREIERLKAEKVPFNQLKDMRLQLQEENATLIVQKLQGMSGEQLADEFLRLQVESPWLGQTDTWNKFIQNARSAGALEDKDILGKDLGATEKAMLPRIVDKRLQQIPSEAGVGLIQAADLFGVDFDQEKLNPEMTEAFKRAGYGLKEIPTNVTLEAKRLLEEDKRFDINKPFDIRRAIDEAKKTFGVEQSATEHILNPESSPNGPTEVKLGIGEIAKTLWDAGYRPEDLAGNPAAWRKYFMDEVKEDVFDQVMDAWTGQ